MSIAPHERINQPTRELDQSSHTNVTSRELVQDVTHQQRQKLIGELATSIASEPLQDRTDIDYLYAQYPVNEDDALPESPSKSQLIDVVRSKGGDTDAKTLAVHEIRELGSHHTLDNISTMELARLAQLLADINNQEKRYSAAEEEREKVVAIANTAIQLLNTVTTAESLADQAEANHRVATHYRPEDYALWQNGRNTVADPTPHVEPETKDDQQYTASQLRARRFAEFLERDKAA